MEVSASTDWPTYVCTYLLINWKCLSNLWLWKIVYSLGTFMDISVIAFSAAFELWEAGASLQFRPPYTGSHACQLQTCLYISFLLVTSAHSSESLATLVLSLSSSQIVSVSERVMTTCMNKRIRGCTKLRIDYREHTPEHPNLYPWAFQHFHDASYHPLPKHTPVSYTHLTLPTICSV